MLGHALATTSQHIFGAPGDLWEAGHELFPKIAGNNLGIPSRGEAGERPFLATSNELSGATGLGLENHPELKPTSVPERYGVALAESLPMAGIMAATGGGALPSLAISASGAVAAQAAHDYDPESTVLPFVAGTFASLGAGGLTASFERSLAGRRATKALSRAEQELQAAEDAAVYGRDPAAKAARRSGQAENELMAVQDDVAAGRYDQATAALKIKSASQARLQASKDAAEALVAQAEKEAADLVEQTAGKLGKSATPEQAGKVLQEDGRNWRNKIMPKKLSEAEKPYKELVPDDTQNPIFGFNNALDSITAEGGKLSELVAELTPKLPARLKKILNDALDSPAGKNATEAKPTFSKTLLDADGKPLQTGTAPAQAAEPLTTGEVRTLRSALGDAMSNPKVVNEIGESNLRHLYAAVTGDLRSTAKEMGALEHFDRYNEVSTKLYNLASGPMSRIFKSTTGALEDGVGGITPYDAALDLMSEAKKGGSLIAQLREEIPKAMDELAAAQLRHAGADGLSVEGRVALFGQHEASLAEAQALRAKAAENSARTQAQAAKDHSDMLEATAAAKLDGNYSRLQALRTAQRAKAAEAAAQAQAEREASFATNVEVHEARRKVEAARAAVPEATTPWYKSPVTNAGAGMSVLGYNFADNILTGMGLNASSAGTTALTAAGLALPLTLKSLKALAARPMSATIPLSGLLAGENALAPDQVQTRVRNFP